MLPSASKGPSSWATTASIDAGSDRSQWRWRAAPAGASLTSSVVTSWPAATSRWSVALPMPVEAPVSRTRLDVLTAPPSGHGTGGWRARGGRDGGAPRSPARGATRCGASSRNTARSSQRARLAPRQKCSPKPNARWWFGVAADVEAVRVGELALVAVGRRVPQRDRVAGPDRDAAAARSRRRRVRANWTTGEVQRRISSTAVSTRPPGSAASRSRSVGVLERGRARRR